MPKSKHRNNRNNRSVEARKRSNLADAPQTLVNTKAVPNGDVNLQQISVQRIGPLPIPAELEHYNRIAPELLPHILKTAELAQEHAHALEREWQGHSVRIESEEVRTNSFLARSAASMTWVILLATLYGGYLFYQAEQYALAAGFLAIGGLSKVIALLSKFFNKDTAN
jgi:uncharacterized membrane protein